MPRKHLLLVVVLFGLGTFLRFINLNNVTWRTPDEKVYTWQARTWIKSGAPGLRSMVAEYKADADTRLYPPPTRVGMIRLVAALLRASGRSDDGAGAVISCLASVGSLFMVALIAVRFAPPWAGAAAVLFYSVLPAELAVSRRTWTDALIELAVLLLIWLSCEITKENRKVPAGISWYPAFALISALALTVKESMPVPVTLCGIWILWYLVRRQEWKNAALFVAFTLTANLIALWWLADQVGSLSDFIGIVLGIPAVNATNPYALEYASGPPWLLLYAFWIVTPITSLLSLAGCCAAVRMRSQPLLLLTFFTTTYVAIAMSMPHWINLRYVGGAFGPFCILAGLGAWWLSSLAEGKWQRWSAVAAIAIVLTGAFMDYQRFRLFFVEDEIGDLSIKLLADEHNQVPQPSADQSNQN